MTFDFSAKPVSSTTPEAPVKAPVATVPLSPSPTPETPSVSPEVKSVAAPVPHNIKATPLPPLVVNPDEVAKMLFNTMVIYGPTGSRKTSQLRDFAKYVYEMTGKKTRMISMDGGGYGTAQDVIDAGILEVWRVVEEEKPLAMLQHASLGKWPKTLKDGARVGNALASDMKDCGAYAVEGWFSIANAVMRYLVGKGQKINEDVVSKFTEDSDFGQLSFGAPSRGHYGFAQNCILDLIRNFSGLGRSRIIYTSLEGKGEDKMTKALSYGPATAGGAITAAIPQYVGDCLHFEDFQVDIGADPDNKGQKLTDTQVRAWFTSHPDSQTGVMWPAKARVIPPKVEEFKKIMGKNGYFNLKDKSLYDYLKAQDELLNAGTNEMLEWKRKVDEARADKANGKS